MAELLAAAALIPISQLTPDLTAPSTRYIRAIVTLIWPYSSSNSTLTVLLAEPDFRLRRTKGQVRVQFSGSSARTVFEAGIGSGDELILSLDGVDWTKDESAGQTPGRSIDWELKFSERLVLKIQQSESEKISLLDIDHPVPRPQPELIEHIPELEALPSPSTSTILNASRPGLTRSEINEWSSPAFVKRARVSYGSLFESSYDMFAEEDGTVQGKGRKRTRFSRNSGLWRYSSRSQSPETSQAGDEIANSGFLESDKEDRPRMTDEGCQTLGLEDDSAAEAMADFSKQQAPAVENLALLNNSPVVREVGAIGQVEELSSFDASVDMRSLPLSPATLRDGIQKEDIVQQTSSHDVEKIGEPAQIEVDPPHTTSIVSLIQQPGTITDVATHPNAIVEVEDLYGLSPTADGYPRTQSPGAAFEETMAYDVAPQMKANGDRSESPPFEYREPTIVYPELLSQPTSPDNHFGTASQSYPEPDLAIGHDFAAQSSPYYNEQFQSHPDGDDRHLNLPSGSQLGIPIEDARSPNATSLAGYEMSPGIPMQKLLPRHLSPGGIATSSSQSGNSEMIDLTEDSDEEEAGLAEGSQASSEAEADERFYQKAEAADGLGGDEGYENLLYGRSRSESIERDFGYDDEYNIRRPPGFHHIKHLAPSEVEDDEDNEGEEYEEDGDEHGDEEADEEGERAEYDDDETEGEEGEEEEEFDEEDSSEEENMSDDEAILTPAQRPMNSEPEVIDLLSSDEDEKNDDAIRGPMELVESGTGRLNETPSMFLEEEKSDSDTESDIEDFEEEVTEDENPEEDLLNGPRALHFRDATEPAAMEGLMESIAEELSEEDETEEGDGMKEHAKVFGATSKAATTLGPSQGIQSDSVNQASPTHNQINDYVGHDGTSDNMDRLSVIPTAVGEVGTKIIANFDQVPSSGDVTYPILPLGEEYQVPHQEKTDQRDDALRVTRNDQLPTPDATQLSAVIAPGTSFGSVNSIEPSFGRMDSINGIVGNSQNSLQQQSIETYEVVTTQTSATEFATDTHEDLTRENLGEINSGATDIIQTTTTVVVTVESEMTDGEATADLIADITREVLPENIPNGTAEIINEALIETVNPPPVTPRRSKRLSFSQQQRDRVERSPSINMYHEPTTPDEYDASVELAMAGLNSPSKQCSTKQQVSGKELRVMLTRPLRTNLGDFTTLKLVRFNLEKKLDVLAVVTTLPSEPQRAKGGLRHYHLRFNVTDATIAPSGVVSINIFRPYKTALPIVHPGEVVLLRNFLARSEKGAGFTLRSDDSSSWVVFKHNGDEEVKGPPVEYGDEEREHAAHLKAWSNALDAVSQERLEKANGDKVV